MTQNPARASELSSETLAEILKLLLEIKADIQAISSAPGQGVNFIDGRTLRS